MKYKREAENDIGYHSGFHFRTGAAAKEALPLAEQIARARDLDSNTGFPFEQALVKQGMSFICEVKKHRPPRD